MARASGAHIVMRLISLPSCYDMAAIAISISSQEEAPLYSSARER